MLYKIAKTAHEETNVFARSCTIKGYLMAKNLSKATDNVDMTEPTRPIWRMP